MTKEALAAALHGNEIGHEITAVMAREAELAGLVVVFGASDDLLELRGAIHDEVDAWEGTTILVTREGLWDEEGCASQCDHFLRAREEAREHGQEITALWATEEPYSWTYTTTIPHATFDILEDGEPYCRGIVFVLAEVTP